MRSSRPTSAKASCGVIGCREISVTSLHVFARREAGHQIVELEDEADVIAAIAGKPRLVEAGEFVILEPGLAGTGAVQPPDDVEEGRLSRTRWSEDDDELAA